MAGLLPTPPGKNWAMSLKTLLNRAPKNQAVPICHGLVSQPSPQSGESFTHHNARDSQQADNDNAKQHNSLARIHSRLVVLPPFILDGELLGILSGE